MDERMKLMRAIQDLSFAKDETVLFLDTHPNCQGAMEYLADVIQRLDSYVEEYQNRYGPLFHEGAMSDTWKWAEGAWPWQNDKMTRGKS